VQANPSGWTVMKRQYYGEVGITVTNVQTAFERVTDMAEINTASIQENALESQNPAEELSKSLQDQLGLIEEIPSKNEQDEEKAKQLVTDLAE